MRSHSSSFRSQVCILRYGVKSYLSMITSKKGKLQIHQCSNRRCDQYTMKLLYNVFTLHDFGTCHTVLHSKVKGYNYKFVVKTTLITLIYNRSSYYGDLTIGNDIEQYKIRIINFHMRYILKHANNFYFQKFYKYLLLKKFSNIQYEKGIACNRVAQGGLVVGGEHF